MKHFVACLVLAISLAGVSIALAEPSQQALGPSKCGHGHFPPCPPPPPPVPIAINFNPAAPSIPDDTPVGSVIATIAVTMSDRSVFAGTLGFGSPYSNGGGVCAIQGTTVLLAAATPTGPATVNCTITATQ